MSPIGHVGVRPLVGLLLLLGLTGCSRSPERQRKQAPAQASNQAPLPRAPDPASADTEAIAFQRLDPRKLPTRGVPTGTEGRFSTRPAIVASPCGFHLVVSETEQSWTALLLGHDLSWSEESAPPLLALDGITLDVGLIDARTMGSPGAIAPDALLDLTGQWESTWLRRDVGTGGVPIKENARGQAHLEPHPLWRVWSATLGPQQTSAGMPASHVIVATVALGERVLVLRALLEGEELALRALRRLVFAVDSIEHEAGAIARTEFVEKLEKAVQADPTCSALHDAHDAQLR